MSYPRVGMGIMPDDEPPALVVLIVGMAPPPEAELDMPAPALLLVGEAAQVYCTRVVVPETVTVDRV